jgi:hypothetical protein
MSEIVNKIQQSKLKTVDLEKFLVGESFQELDVKQFLFKEMILKEDHFRKELNQHDWIQYKDKWLAVYCSTDAIIPSWAWMLIVTYAGEYAKDVIFGTEPDAKMAAIQHKADQHDWSVYKNKFVLLKGCSKMEVPPAAFLEATKKLIPFADKLMYGEACSNVPVYRKTKKNNAAT